MGLRATTVRISDDLWQLLETEASRQQISVAQFLRDAALLRLGQIAHQREDPAARLTIEELARRSIEERRRFDAPAQVQPLSDPDRLQGLRRTQLLDRPVDPALDRLTRLAARALNVPVVLVSLVDSQRQFFAAHCGLPEPWQTRRQTALSYSFCKHVVISREPFVVCDTRQHPDVRANPAIRDLHVLAYAGVPLATADGQVLGSFCAIDTKARVWTSHELDFLTDFAASAMAIIDLRSDAAAAA